MTTTQASVTTWDIDPIHTSAEFGVKHLGISTFKGRFRAVEGVLRIDEDNPVNSSVTASIDSTSIDLSEQRFLGHVLNSDFLDSDNYPTMTFRSTRVERVDDSNWNVTGNLTIRDVTREVVFATEFLGRADHPFTKKTVAAFTAEADIDRTAFGVKWNLVLDTGGQYLGEQVRITLRIEAIRQD